MKHKKVTENEREEIKEDMQGNEESHLGGREGEERQHQVPQRMKNGNRA